MGAEIFLRLLMNILAAADEIVYLNGPSEVERRQDPLL
jgi:hypothetical protein